MLKQQLLAGCTAALVAASVLAIGPAATAANTPLRFSEVESSDGAPGDWVEIFNAGTKAVDLSGFVFKDGDDAHLYALPAGTSIAAGGYLVLDELAKGSAEGGFDFGLGKADSARLFDPAGTLVDAYSWAAHAPVTYGITASGDWAETSEPTRGAANVFATPAPGNVLLNEVDSQPADWVELVNTGASALDLSGYELRDNSDDHSWRFPAGAQIAPGEFLVVTESTAGIIGEQPGAFGDAIGIGGADRIRLFAPDATLIDDTGAWEGHATVGGDAALATLARCVDGTGAFVLAHPTPGAKNVCATDPGTDPGTEAPEAAAWPGAPATRAIDAASMFLADSSGLDTQLTADGVSLWAVDNGQGRFWKLDAKADGTATFAPGWEAGKRARFQRDADRPGAKGPDTEGISVDGDGFLYLASERDNGAKGVNQNTVLKLDPAAPGPDVIATQEWDITSILPAVSANLGIEAIEWVSDADLAGKLVDTQTGAPYTPTSYPGHGDGLFFVAVEDGGQVFALALNSDGTAKLVAELKPRLAGVMALDWDTVKGGLWAVCDDGCSGAAAFITLNGTDSPELKHFTRPEGLPNTNNEGFATSPAALTTGGATPATVAASGAASAAQTAQRPVWWFTDGAKSGALRAGTLFTAPTTDGGPGTDGPGTDGPGTGGPGTDGSGQGGQVTGGGKTPTADTAKPADTARLADTGSQSQAATVIALAATLGGLVLVGTALAVGARRRLRA